MNERNTHLNANHSWVIHPEKTVGVFKSVEEQMKEYKLDGYIDHLNLKGTLTTKVYSNNSPNPLFNSIQLSKIRRLVDNKLIRRSIEVFFYNDDAHSELITHLKKNYEIDETQSNHKTICFVVGRKEALYNVLYLLNCLSPFSEPMKMDLSEHLSQLKAPKNIADFREKAFSSSTHGRLFSLCKVAILQNMNYHKPKLNSLPSDLNLTL